MKITATAPDGQYQPGDQVSVIRTIQVGYRGVFEDWTIGPADQATDGQIGPGWGDAAGHTVTRAGWGTGHVHEILDPTYAVPQYRVELDA